MLIDKSLEYEGLFLFVCQPENCIMLKATSKKFNCTFRSDRYISLMNDKKLEHTILKYVSQCCDHQNRAVKSDNKFQQTFDLSG